MIAWILFVSLITMFLWWLGGIMMPHNKTIIQELIKMEEGE